MFEDYPEIKIAMSIIAMMITISMSRFLLFTIMPEIKETVNNKVTEETVGSVEENEIELEDELSNDESQQFYFFLIIIIVLFLLSFAVIATDFEIFEDISDIFIHCLSCIVIALIYRKSAINYLEEKTKILASDLELMNLLKEQLKKTDDKKTVKKVKEQCSSIEKTYNSMMIMLEKLKTYDNEISSKLNLLKEESE